MFELILTHVYYQLVFLPYVKPSLYYAGSSVSDPYFKVPAWQIQCKMIKISIQFIWLVKPNKFCPCHVFRIVNGLLLRQMWVCLLLLWKNKFSLVDNYFSKFTCRPCFGLRPCSPYPSLSDWANSSTICYYFVQILGSANGIDFAPIGLLIIWFMKVFIIVVCSEAQVRIS